MEVNNVGQIIYPQNLKKYTGCVEEIRSKNNHYKIISFRARIRSPNFKFSKCFSSRQEGEVELINLTYSSLSLTLGVQVIIMT